MMNNVTREPEQVVGLPRILICKMTKIAKLQKNEDLGGRKIDINWPVLRSKSNNLGEITEAPSSEYIIVKKQEDIIVIMIKLSFLQLKKISLNL